MVGRLHRACSLVLCCLSCGALAQSPPALLRNPSEQLLREQQERERAQMLGPQALPLAQQVDEREAPFPAHLASPDGPSFDIQQITASGEILISQREFRRIVAVFEGHTLGAAQINALLDRLSRALVASGYITSRATVSNQSLAAGELSITVLAGHIEQIRYNDEVLAPGGSNALGVRLALPMRQGDILRLQDIEQAVDQLNRLRRNAAQVQILPGEQTGGSIVALSNRPGDARSYSASTDNQGSASTGRVRLQGGVDQGNALGLMESLSLGLVTSADTNAVFGSLSVPLGYYTLGLMRSWSEYQNLIGDTALVYGNSQSQSITLNRLLQRSQDSKLALDLSLTRRTSTRAINNLALSPQTQAVARLGVNQLSRFRSPHGLGQWTLDLGVVRGLRSLGADRDPAELPAGAARGQFTKLETSVGAQLPLSARWTWRTRLAHQWTRNPLYSSEQLFAGGVASVRGFAESAAGGDRGYFMRNEWLLQDLAPLGLGSARLQWQPYVFLDGARLRTLSDARRQRLLSAGVGARLTLGAASGEIIIGRPLLTPEPSVRKATQVNLQLGYQF